LNVRTQVRARDRRHQRGLAAALIVVTGCLAAAGCTPRQAPPGPAVLAPHLNGGFFVTRDGLELPLHVWTPAAPDDAAPAPEPLAVVIGLHGMNDYGNAFGLPAPTLADRGVITYAYDQRGFGGAPDRGLFASPELLAQDVADLSSLLRRRHPELPLYVVGISMGGAVALTALASDTPPDVDGAVLVAPAVWGRRTMPFYQPPALWVAAHTTPWMTLTGRGIKVRPSDNIEMLRALGRDPLVLKETRVDAIWGLVNLMDRALESASDVTQPLLILYGEKDDLVPRRPTREMVGSLPRLDGRRQRLALYEDSYHMLLRGLDSDRVLTDVVAWLQDPDRDALPSSADKVESGSFLNKHRERGAD